MSSAKATCLYATFDALPAASGRARRSRQLIDALRGDYECHCVCLQDEGQALFEEVDGVRYRRVMAEGLTLSECVEVYAQTVCGELERLGARIVILADPFSASVLCGQKARGERRIIYEASGLPSFELEAIQPDWRDEFDAAHEESLRQALREQERFCLRNADVVLVGSTVTAELARGWGVSPEAIAILPTSAETLLPATDRNRSVDAPLELFFEGAFAPWQGLSTLFEAIALARAQVPVRLTMMGAARPRAFMESLRLRLESLAIGENVTLMEPLEGPALAQMLQGMDVGVVPLERCPRNEVQGAPLAKMATYLGAGLAVLACDLPMARQLVDERCALFFEPGNAAQLASRIIELAHSPSRRQAMGQAGRQHAEESLSMARMRGALLAICEDLLSAPRSVAEARSDAADFDLAAACAWLRAANEGARADEDDEADDDFEELAEEELEELEMEPLDDESAEADGGESPSAARADASVPAQVGAGEDVARAKGAEAAREAEDDADEATVMDLDDLLDDASDDESEPQYALTESLARELAECLGQKHGARSPKSGMSLSDEWLSHVLLGYAPFAVDLGDDGPPAAVEFSPVPRHH
ncbi:MAG: glycosyltransferase [Myxococcaceae bacterium]|nr:glycosyltransferase [Myxococcaceae bacterium]